MSEKTLPLLGLLLLASACDKPAPPSSTTAPTSEAKAFSEAEIKIEHLRKQTPPDWVAIRECFQTTLPIVEKADGEWGTTYATDIPAALERCKRGDRPRVAQQILAKGLQHVVVLTVRSAFARIEKDPASAESEAAFIADLLEGIRPTFSRRDRDYFPETPVLEPALDDAIGKIRNAGSRPVTLPGARRVFDDAVARTYALSVLYEIEAVENLREKDRPACDIKVMEAVIFLRIIEERIAMNAPDAARGLKTILEGSVDAMSAAAVKGNLRKGLPGLDLEKRRKPTSP